MAVTNYHKLSRLNNTKICDVTVLETRSPKWVSLRENQGVDKVCVPFRGESTSWPCLVSASRGHLHSLAHSPFSVFKVLSIASSNLWLPHLSCKKLFHYIGPTQIIQDNLISNFFELITSAKSLFPRKEFIQYGHRFGMWELGCRCISGASSPPTMHTIPFAIL